MKLTRKRKRTIVIAAAAAVLIVGAVAAFLLLRGGGSEGTAYVQRVADITGQGAGALLEGRYSGVIEAKEIIKIKLDTDKQLDECFVEVGDRVSAGTPLFSYDVDSLTLSYEQLKLDYEGKLNNIATMQDQIKDLEKQIKRAKGATKAELTIQLQTTQLNLKKEEYEAQKKKLDVDDAESIIRDNVVKAKAEGTVRSINPPAEDGTQNDGMSTDNAYITIVAGNDYCVKGTISEQGAYQLMAGTPVIIRSRVDEKQTWNGVIDSVNTEQPVTNEQNYYYGGNMGEQASKYAFYVALEGSEGLLMGQHVYIELDVGQQESAALMLPEYYLMAEDGGFAVYAASKRGRIEKRAVTVGVYDETLGTYEILDGLSLQDSIAFPDETVKPGMVAVDAGYADAAEGGMESEGGMAPDAAFMGGEGAVIGG